MSLEREFDVVVWGATGFTGQLVAEYLLGRAPASGIRWALGGRSREKLETLQRALGPDAAGLPLVVGDAGDPASTQALAQRTRVVCTTVGPYARYGSELVAACARAGTHYCDLTGEVHWIRRMIDAHHDDAVASGARIVPTCGFDSIPSDLGVYFVQREMRRLHGVHARRVRLRVKGFSGGASGGTIASMLNMLEEAGSDPEVRRTMSDPYAINPKDQRAGPDRGEAMAPAWDADFGEWTGPFVMAAINTRVVRRSNAVQGHPYGADFRYDEAMLTGSGPAGYAKAVGIAAGLGAAMAAGSIGPLRRAMARWLPAPGEGPSASAREAGYFDLRLVAEHPDAAGRNVRARVTGDRDPGYGSTSKMLGEAALCLAQDELTCAGGFWTPASAMAEPLLARLQANAGLVFTLDD